MRQLEDFIGLSRGEAIRLKREIDRDRAQRVMTETVLRAQLITSQFHLTQLRAGTHNLLKGLRSDSN